MVIIPRTLFFTYIKKGIFSDGFYRFGDINLFKCFILIPTMFKCLFSYGFNILRDYYFINVALKIECTIFDI